MSPVARTWLSIRVELVSGRGELLWPRPGRILAAPRTTTFAQLATAIDDAFARWDRAHLHLFHMQDGNRIGRPDWDDEHDGLDGRQVRLSRLAPGEQFAYEFDLGDRWMHLCTVAEQRIDPLEELGVVPDEPVPYWGWGDLPDQYGRRWDDDEDEDDLPPPDPGLQSLPPLVPGWGPRTR
jgi:hypothetical protein